MYWITAPRFDSLTVKAPYPPCQEKRLRSGHRSLIHRRGIRLHNAQAISHRKVGGQAHQQMNVIRGPANGDGNGAQLLENSTDVAVRIGADRLGKEWPAFRGGEDSVRKQARKSVSHSYAPSGGW